MRKCIDGSRMDRRRRDAIPPPPWMARMPKRRERPITDDEWKQLDATFERLRHARRTMGPEEVEAVLASWPESRVGVPIPMYLRAHAKTPALIHVLRTSDDPGVKYQICWVFHLYPTI